MDCVTNIPVYDPFQKQNIGRRTGKVIAIKKGPLSSVEDFFSDSESDATLNITKQTPEVRPVLSPTAESNSDLEKTDFDNPAKNSKTLSSLQQIPDTIGTDVIYPFPGTRYGRRTGKDILAGKKKLIQSNGVGNFSDFFTDSDASYSLNPTPRQSPAVGSTLSSAGESDNKDSSYQGNVSSDKEENEQSPIGAHTQHNKSAPNPEEKENSVLESNITKDEFKKSYTKSSSHSTDNVMETDSQSVQFPRNSSKSNPESAQQSREESQSEGSQLSSRYEDTEPTVYASAENHSLLCTEDSGENDHSSHLDKGANKASEETDNENLANNASNERHGTECPDKSSNEGVQEYSETESQTNVSFRENLQRTNSSCNSSEFKAPLPRDKEARETSHLTHSNYTQEHVSEDPIAFSQKQESKVNKSNGLTPNNPQKANSDLDFGGDITGSVSQADKLEGKQFFGIRKRLTFSKVLESRAQEPELPPQPPENTPEEDINSDEENCDDFMIIENNEIVISLPVTDEKVSQKSKQEDNSKSSSQKSLSHRRRKNTHISQNDPNQNSRHIKQGKNTNENGSELSVKTDRKKPGRKSQNKANEKVDNSSTEEKNKKCLEHDMHLQGKQSSLSYSQKKMLSPVQHAINISENETIENKGGRKKQNRKRSHSNKKGLKDSIYSLRSDSEINDEECEVSPPKQSHGKESTKCLKRDEKKVASKGKVRQNRSRKECNEMIKEVLSDLSPRPQIDVTGPQCALEQDSGNQDSSLKLIVGSPEKPLKCSKRERRQTQLMQYPFAEKSGEGRQSISSGSIDKVMKMKDEPLPSNQRQPRKSFNLRRSPDRQRKLSRQSSGRRKTNGMTRKDSYEVTPVQLHPLSMLPNVTPKSGVSFRSRSSCFAFLGNESISTSDVNKSKGHVETSDLRSPFISKPTPLRTSKSILIRRAIMNSVKNQKANTDENVSAVTELEERLSINTEENSTILPSPSSSPVHYLETSTSNRKSNIFRPPDCSKKIVHPEKVDGELRRSQRTRVRRLNRDMGEGIVYRRDSTGFGWLVDRVQTSTGAIQVFQKEKDRLRKHNKKKFSVKTVPAKSKRLSTHMPIMEDISDSPEVPVVNPETNETVNIELVARTKDAVWLGPDLNPVTSMDPVAFCSNLNQPIFGTGELQLRPFSEKTEQLAVQTLIYLVMSGKISVTVNNVSIVVQTGDDFFIPRGSYYRLQNLRRDIAKIRYVNLKEDNSSVTNEEPQL